MAINTKAIKTRIGSVKNTYKVTRSMEKISAVKRSKFASMALESKQYTTELSKTNKVFASSLRIDEDSPALLRKRSLDTTLIVLLTSDRGLCGSFNSNIINVASKYIDGIKEVDSSRVIKIMSLGKKGAKLANIKGVTLDSLYDRLFDSHSYDRCFDISREIVRKYLDDECDEVVLIYTSFQSAQEQNIVIEKLLPFKDVSAFKGNITDDTTLPNNEKSEIGYEDIGVGEDYIIEPSVDELQEYIFLKTLDTKIYQSILESSSCEHSSRMIAMKNASDNATELSDALTLTFNKGRQASITQEVSEIVSGIEALGSNVN